jgi:hypothetical protein
MARLAMAGLVLYGLTLVAYTGSTVADDRATSRSHIVKYEALATTLAQEDITRPAARPQSAAPEAASDPDGEANAATVTITGLADQAALTAGGPAAEFTVRIKAGATGYQGLAQQILIETPEAGPNFTTPDNGVLEQYEPAAKRWQRLSLGQQTGTLFTPVPRSGPALAAGQAREVRYRLRFVKGTPAMSGPLKLDVLVLSLPGPREVGMANVPFTLRTAG